MIKYNKKGRLFSLIGLFLVMLFFSIFASTQISNLNINNENDEINRDIEVKNPSISASRGEIKIYNDSAFISSNGVKGGTGIKGDPYVISNWIINSPASGISVEIANTTSYFEIRDCAFSNGIVGVLLQNVTNGKVFNNTIQGFNNSGIGIVLSKNINLTNNIISNIHGDDGLKGADGVSGVSTDPGTNGIVGGDASGIYTANSSYISISYNNISDIYGGLGGNGGNGGDIFQDNAWEPGGNGGNGADGGSGIGIVVESSNHSVIIKNTIQNLLGGTGGLGGSGGHGSDMNTIEGWGSDGGECGAGGGGGNVIGIFIDPSYNISTYYNNISNLFGGLGGDSKPSGNGGLGNGWFAGGGMGGSGSIEGGEGGSASGMLLDNVHDGVNNLNKIWNIFGGDGGNGGDGGKGGDVTDQDDAMAGMGGFGVKGGSGGYSYGLHFENTQDLNNSFNVIDTILGGSMKNLHVLIMEVSVAAVMMEGTEDGG